MVAQLVSVQPDGLAWRLDRAVASGSWVRWTCKAVPPGAYVLLWSVSAEGYWAAGSEVAETAPTSGRVWARAAKTGDASVERLVQVDYATPDTGAIHLAGSGKVVCLPEGGDLIVQAVATGSQNLSGSLVLVPVGAPDRRPIVAGGQKV